MGLLGSASRNFGGLRIDGVGLSGLIRDLGLWSWQRRWRILVGGAKPHSGYGCWRGIRLRDNST